MKELPKKAFLWVEKISSFRAYALVLLITMALAYDAQVWRMGFYYDDWEGVFLHREGFSALQIWSYFLKDRPFSTITHVVFNPLLGDWSIGWHILGLLLNWGAILFLVKVILQLWPKRVMEAGWIGLLLAVYPGMHRQFVVRTSIPHYASMFLFTLSLFLMVKAVQNNKYRLWLLLSSLLAALLQVLIIEYFSALELIRIPLLFFLFMKEGKTWKQAIKPVLLAWLPYAFVFGTFLLYRFSVLPAIQVDHAAPMHSITLFDQLFQDPVGIILHYIQVVLQDVIYSVFYVWSLPGAPADIDLQSRATVFSWALGLLVGLGCAILVWSWHKKESAGQAQSQQWTWIVLICLAALCLGGAPNWALGHLSFEGLWSDRFLFGQIFGAVPLLVILIVWLVGQDRKMFQAIFFVVLLAASLSLQFRIANKYVLNWQLQQNYYWQIKWRIPSLKPRVFVLSPYTPFDKNANYQIAYAINVIFNSGYDKEDVLYWWFDGPSDLWNVTQHRYNTAGVEHSFRSLTFSSDMQHALPVLFRSARGCLQVADTVYQDEPLLGGEERPVFTVFNPGLVSLDEKQMPQDVFGQEPEHAWCYFYEKADLAREFQQWDRVIQIWNEAGSRRDELHYGPEYLPFIEAFAQNGNWNKAADLTLSANKTTDKMQYFLCGNWARIMAGTAASTDQAAAWKKVQAVLKVCP